MLCCPRDGHSLRERRSIRGEVGQNGPQMNGVKTGEKKSLASCFEVDILNIFQPEPLGFSCSCDI